MRRQTKVEPPSDDENDRRARRKEKRSAEEAGSNRTTASNQSERSTVEPKKDAKSVRLKTRLKQMVLTDPDGGVVQFLSDEFDAIGARPSRFKSFFDANQDLNRHANLLLYDGNRVVLNDGCRVVMKDGCDSDYVHASWVSGFDQLRQYVLTQAPHNPQAELQLWRMILQTQTPILVMLATLRDGRDERTCSNFWPLSGKQTQYPMDTNAKITPSLRVNTKTFSPSTSFDTYDIIVQMVGKQPHQFQLLHFRDWENDELVPQTLTELQIQYRMMLSKAQPNKNNQKQILPPTVIVCQTGVHRAGTFAAMDIMHQQAIKWETVSIESVVRNLRQERYGTVQIYSHYYYLINSIVQFAVGTGCTQHHRKITSSDKRKSKKEKQKKKAKRKEKTKDHS